MASISRPSLVRLIASVIGLFGSVWFVVNYTQASQFRFKFEHEGGRLIAITDVLVQFSTWLPTRLGFERRVRGDHHIFTMEGVEEIINMQPKNGRGKAYQVKQIRDLLLKYKLRMEG